MRRSVVRFEVGEALSHNGKMGLLEGIAARDKLLLLAHVSGDAVGNLGR